MARQHLRPTVHSSSGKITVWGGFTADGPRPLHRIQGNLNAAGYIAILTEHVLPLNLPGQGTMFQQDNATCHTAATTRRFFETNGIELLPWPAQSPDLNPIENVWSYIQQRVDLHEIHGFEQLWNVTLRVWNEMPADYLQNLINSMPRRIREVIAAHGGSIPY